MESNHRLRGQSSPSLPLNERGISRGLSAPGISYRLMKSATIVGTDASIPTTSSMPDIAQQFDDCIFARPGQPRNGADRTALTEKVKDAGTIFAAELVHSSAQYDLFGQRSSMKCQFAQGSSIGTGSLE